MQVAAPSPHAVREIEVDGPRVGLIEIVGVVVGLGFGASVALPIANLSRHALAARGGWATLIGNVTAMGGTYLLAVMVLLAGRLPLLERVVGADRMLGWHRRLAKYPVVLLSAHVLATTIGFAQAARTGLWAELGSFVSTFPDVLAAVVGYVLLLAIAVGSIRAARRTMSYETWWAIHLYTYLAVALSMAHQFVDGTDLVGHRFAQVAWTVLWVATAGVVLVYRVGVPVYRNARMGLRVERVIDEGHGIVSVVCKGRNLRFLGAQGGQFFWWRFGVRGLWWQAHPFSLSATVRADRVRITVRSVGDATSALRRLGPGTRVVAEGPYGAFTAARRSSDKVLLVGAGVGITPIRSLLEDLPPAVDVTLIARARTAEHILFRDELTSLIEARHGTMRHALGRRQSLHFTRANLARTVPDVAERDVYVCGPEAFADQVVAAAEACGVPADAIHRERFAL